MTSREVNFNSHQCLFSTRPFEIILTFNMIFYHRVMDRLIGGAPLITVYVAQVFVLTYRRQLLGMTKYDAIVQFLLKVKIGLVDYLGVEMMMRKKLQQRIQKQKKFRK